MKTNAPCEFEKAMDSGRRLKEMGWDKQRILKSMAESGNFNMAIASQAVDQLFQAANLDSPARFKIAA